MDGPADQTSTRGELSHQSYHLGREIGVDEALMIVRRATFDPGQFTKRVLYAHDEVETLERWQARAVLVALAADEVDDRWGARGPHVTDYEREELALLGQPALGTAGRHRPQPGGRRAYQQKPGEMMSGISGSPAPSEQERAERRAALDQRVRADLRKAVWEASQTMSYDEIRQRVEGTIAEIASDEP